MAEYLYAQPVTSTDDPDVVLKKIAYAAQNGGASGDGTSTNPYTGLGIGFPEVIQAACSASTGNLATGPAVVTFRMPFAMTLTSVRASVSTAPTGSSISLGINQSGASVLSTDLTINAGAKTSTTASVPAVISNPNLTDDAEITIDIDQVGSSTPGVGLVVTLIGRRA